MIHLVAHVFRVAYFECYAIKGAVDFQGMNHSAARAFYLLDFVVIGVLGRVGLVVGGGHAEEVGEDFGVAFFALKLEADGAALQVGERGRGAGLLLNPHKEKNWWREWLGREGLYAAGLKKDEPAAEASYF